ncbi:MAG TPA: hypothetical protein VGM64_20445 [Lacunisphaera sp.]|jgi:hypothetical protein
MTVPAMESLAMTAPRMVTQLVAASDEILLFGRQSARIATIRSNGHIFLIHPRGQPPYLDSKSIGSLSALKVTVLLPGIDENGDGAR